MVLLVAAGVSRIREQAHVTDSGSFEAGNGYGSAASLDLVSGWLSRLLTGGNVELRRLYGKAVEPKNGDV